MSGECSECGEHALECKCGIGCDAPGTKIRKFSLKPVESILIPLSDGIDPPAELPPVRYVNVNGREEHEALLRDEAKMLELGLDPVYKRIVYLKRWGEWLNEPLLHFGSFPWRNE